MRIEVHDPVPALAERVIGAAIVLVSELLVPGEGVPTDPQPAGNYRFLDAPIPEYTERCFEHDTYTEADGTVPVGILNRRIGMGVYQLFNKRQLPHQTTWRMPGESLYVVAIGGYVLIELTPSAATFRARTTEMGAEYDSIGARSQLLRPYPQFGDITTTNNDGKS